MRFMDGYRTALRLGLVVALAATELYLARRISTSSNVVGYTLSRSYTIAPERRAKLKALAVQLGATVAAGQTIAELDPTELDNAIDAARAERDQAIAEIKAQLARLGRDSVDVVRRFASGTERAAAQLATAEAAARTAAAELAAVEAEIAAQRELVDRHLANIAVMNSLELRRAALAKQVDAADHTLAVLRDNASAAAERSARVDTAPGVDSVIAPLEARVRGAELHIEQLERERAGLVLHAPVDGVIDQLPLHPGDLAGPDVPVATVVASDNHRVVACVPEAHASAIEVGGAAELTSAFDHARGEGEIESLTSEIAPLPTRCQPPGSKLVAMGRLAVVALDRPLAGLPGQTQLVHFAARRRARAAAPPAMNPVVGAEPPAVPLKVPGTLLGRTRFEPSGLVWVAAIDRYLIVSDDTGFPDRDDHAPWLFTMTRDGAVDPRPLVVAGIPALDDLEAITADDDGKIWLLSSQSLSKHGKRPAARQELVRITIGPGGAEVDAGVTLAALLARAPEPVRAALGVPDLRTLDIEAIAARGGALYLGLKAPVDGDGRAQIWRVGAPERLLAGDLAGAQLTRWSTLGLLVEADGRSVPGGIADMMFLDDHTLIVSATASGLDPRHQTSVVAIAELAAGQMQPRIVRRFAGLKAEGLARAPGGDALAIVFDRGAEAALWTRLPIRELGTGRAR